MFVKYKMRDQEELLFVFLRSIDIRFKQKLQVSVFRVSYIKIGFIFSDFRLESLNVLIFVIFLQIDYRGYGELNLWIYF